MKSKTYSEKLLDPRWQKKRLEILQRDEFMCKTCGESGETLHVHHLMYEKNKEPWDYDNTCFITYCKNCHENATEIDLAIKKSLKTFNNCDSLLELSRLINVLERANPYDIMQARRFAEFLLMADYSVVKAAIAFVEIYIEDIKKSDK